jgi:tetratricopeptide (TPR) repeat protein
MVRARFGWAVCLLLVNWPVNAQETPAAHPLAGKQVLLTRIDVPLFVLKDSQWQEAGKSPRPIAVIKQANDGAYRVQAGEVDGWVRKAEAVLLDEAVPFFTERLQKDSNDAFAHAQRAIARSERRYTDYDGAIADLDEAIRLQPGVSLYWRHRGLIRAFKGDYDRALADLDEAIRLDPAAADGYNKRAQVRTRKKDYDGTLADSEDAIRREPRNGDHYGQRANAWFAKGQFDKAWDDLNKAVQLNPDVGWFYYMRSERHVQFGELLPAVADLNQAITLEPDIGTWYMERARVHLMRADYASALEDSDRALKLDPTNSLYYLRKMDIFVRREAWDEALAVATEGLRVCPDHKSDLYGNRATLRALKRDYKGALADLDSALHEAPGTLHYQRIRAELLATCPDDAVRDLPRAITEAAQIAEQIGAKDVAAIEQVAFYCALAGRTEDAERWRARASGLKPPAPMPELPPLPPAGKP